MDRPAPSVDSAFAGYSRSVREIYQRLIAAIRAFGAIAEEVQADAIAVTASHRTFAEARPRGDLLAVVIRSDDAIANGRMRRIERDADGGFRNELLLNAPDDVNDELMNWLRLAYEHARDGPKA